MQRAAAEQERRTRRAMAMQMGRFFAYFKVMPQPTNNWRLNELMRKYYKHRPDIPVDQRDAHFER